MKEHLFGKTGRAVSEIGLGTWQLGQSRAENRPGRNLYAVRMAQTGGIRI